MPTDPQDNLFVYLLLGNGRFGTSPDRINSKHAVLFQSGDMFQAAAGGAGMRMLLLAGKPLRETVAWGGPIVMNTQEELDLAFRELDNGTFIKKRDPQHG